jgi:hypothetical protein
MAQDPVMLSVANEPIMLSVIRPSVVMLKVVEPVAKGLQIFSTEFLKLEITESDQSDYESHEVKLI